jgi:hypothetical protein
MNRIGRLAGVQGERVGPGVSVNGHAVCFLGELG